MRRVSAGQRRRAEGADRDRAIVMSLMRDGFLRPFTPQSLLLHCRLRGALRYGLDWAGGVLQTVCFRNA